jgi:TolA-binding protein
MSEEHELMTLLELTRELGIRCETAREYLESRGIAGYGPDNPVPQPVIDILRAEFGHNPSLLGRLSRGIRSAFGGFSRTEGKLRKLALALIVSGEKGGETATEEAGADGQDFPREDSEGFQDASTTLSHEGFVSGDQAVEAVEEAEDEEEWARGEVTDLSEETMTTSPAGTEERPGPDVAEVRPEEISGDDEGWPGGFHPEDIAETIPEEDSAPEPRSAAEPGVEEVEVPPEVSIEETWDEAPVAEGTGEGGVADDSDTGESPKEPEPAVAGPASTDYETPGPPEPEPLDPEGRDTDEISPVTREVDTGEPEARKPERSWTGGEAEEDEEPLPEETLRLQEAIQRLLDGTPEPEENDLPEVAARGTEEPRAEVELPNERKPASVRDEEDVIPVSPEDTIARASEVPEGASATGEGLPVDPDYGQEEIDNVVDQLSGLEDILTRMTAERGEDRKNEDEGPGEDREEAVGSVEDSKDSPGISPPEGFGPGASRTGSVTEGEEMPPGQGEGVPGDAGEGDEDSRQELEESLAELESLLAELSTGNEDEDDGEVTRDGGEDDRVSRASESDIHAVLRGESVVDEAEVEKSGLEGGARETHTADEDLFDLSVLLEGVESAESENEDEEVVPPTDLFEPVEAVEETEEPVSAGPRRRNPVRKWLRRNFGPAVSGILGAVRGSFGGLSPLQRRIFAGTAMMVALFLAAAVVRNAWIHRPQGRTALWERGNRLLDSGRADLARLEFAKLVSRYPDPQGPYFRQALYLLGECRYQEGEYVEALQTFLKVKNLLAARPREIDGLLYPDFTFRGQGELRIADCYVKTGRFQDGVDAYDRIIERDQYSPAAHTAALEKAEAYLAWGEREGNPSYFRHAVNSFRAYRLDFPLAERESFIQWRTAHAYRGLARTDQKNAREHNQRAMVELEEARRREEEFVQWGLKDRAALLLDLAETYADLSLWPYATAEYEGIIAMDPPREILVDARLGLSGCLLESEDFERAFEVAGLAAETAQDPEDRAIALFRKGEAAYELQRYEEMLHAYEVALETGGDEDFPRSLAERAHMRITNVLFTREKNYAEAAKRYRQIISRYPDGTYTHQALYRLGSSLFALGKYEEAAEAYKRSIRNQLQFEHRDPDLVVDAYYQVAESYMRLESWPEAVEALKEALQDLHYPEDERGRKARLDLASCYAAMSLYDKAIPVLENYLEKFPSDDPSGEVTMQLGEYYRSRLDFAAARSLHQRVAETHQGEPVAVGALFAEGEDLVAEASLAPDGEKELLLNAALLRFERVLQLRPEDAAPCYEIARIYHGRREFSAARVYLGRYFELTEEGPKTAYAHFLAADAAYGEEDYPAAVEHFEALGDNDLAEAVIAQASYEHADALRQTGDLDRASHFFAETARLFPATEWGKEARWQLDHLAWQQRLVDVPVN